MLSNNLASRRPDIMQIRIPQLKHRLQLKPPLINQQRVHHTSTVLPASRLLRRLHHRMRDDPRVGTRYERFFQLTRNALFDQVAQLQGDFRDFRRRDRGGQRGLFEGREQPSRFFSPEMAICAILAKASIAFLRSGVLGTRLRGSSTYLPSSPKSFFH